MLHLFSYGSLMCSDIFAEVTGCSCVSFPAVLDGYIRRCVKQELYPAIISSAGACIDGTLYQNLPHAAWRRLDDFEGTIYLRRAVVVTMEQGVKVAAETYVLRKEYTSLLEKKEWNFTTFIERKEEFITQYRGFTGW